MQPQPCPRPTRNVVVSSTPTGRLRRRVWWTCSKSGPAVCRKDMCACALATMLELVRACASAAKSVPTQGRIQRICSAPLDAAATAINSTCSGPWKALPVSSPGRARAMCERGIAVRARAATQISNQSAAMETGACWAMMCERAVTLVLCVILNTDPKGVPSHLVAFLAPFCAFRAHVQQATSLSVLADVACLEDGSRTFATAAATPRGTTAMSPGTLSVSHPRLEALAAETAAKYETWNLELLADVATRGQTSTTRDYAAMHHRCRRLPRWVIKMFGGAVQCPWCPQTIPVAVYSDSQGSCPRLEPRAGAVLINGRVVPPGHAPLAVVHDPEPARCEKRVPFLLDSGAAEHVAPRRDLLSNVVPSCLPFVGVGGGIITCKSKGTIGAHLQNVYEVQQSPWGLISIVRLLRTWEGSAILFTLDGVYKIEKGGRSTHATPPGKQRPRIVKTKIGSLVKNKFVACDEHFGLRRPKSAGTRPLCPAQTNKAMLWHHRLGHPSNARLKQLINTPDNTIPLTAEDTKHMDSLFCEACTYGKMKKTSFPRKARQRAHFPGGRICVDTHGPLSKRTLLGGACYFTVFVDDCTRRSWVYLHKRRKGSVMVKLFMKFLQDFSQEAGLQAMCFDMEWRPPLRPVNTLRSDNASEFVYGEVGEWLRGQRIKHERTVAHSSEQNGIAERRIRTLNNVARCSLAHARLSISYWGWAVYAANYQVNRLPTVANRGLSPMHRWAGTPPSCDMLRTWGCPAYVHLPSKKRARADRMDLSPAAKKGVFVGYAAHAKGWLIFIPESRALLTCRSVAFDETRTRTTRAGVSPQAPMDSTLQRQLDTWHANDAVTRRLVSPSVIDLAESEPPENAPSGHGGVTAGSPTSPDNTGSHGAIGMVPRSVGVDPKSGSVAVNSMDATVRVHPPDTASTRNPVPVPVHVGSKGDGEILQYQAEDASGPTTGKADDDTANATEAEMEVVTDADTEHEYDHDRVLRPRGNDGQTKDKLMYEPSIGDPVYKTFEDGEEYEGRIYDVSMDQKTGEQIFGVLYQDLDKEDYTAKELLELRQQHERKLRVEAPEQGDQALTAVIQELCHSGTVMALTVGAVHHETQSVKSLFALANAIPGRSGSRPGGRKGARMARDVPIPLNAKAALSGPDGADWQRAITKELDQMEKFDVWEIVPRRSAYKRPISMTWAFKCKSNKDGTIERFKARLCARGFLQRFGIDYRDTYAPVARLITIRILIALAAISRYSIKHVDFESAFLQGALSETVFVEIPIGMTAPPGSVIKLLKSIYGLKQAGRVWFDLLIAGLMDIGFTQSHSDPCFVYMKGNKWIIYISIWVDDCIVVYSDLAQWERVEAAISRRFRVGSTTDFSWCLGMAVEHLESGSIRLHQQLYVETLIDTFKMEKAHPISVPMAPTTILCKAGVHGQDIPCEYVGQEIHALYRSLLGALLHLANFTRPDIAYAVGVCAKYTNYPRMVHWKALKGILRYLKGTKEKGLIYGVNQNQNKVAYSYVGTPKPAVITCVDANWARDVDDRKSTSAFVFLFWGCVVSWYCRKQSVVALSTAEAEYYAASEATKEAIWVSRMLAEIGIVTGCVPLLDDSQACIRMVERKTTSNKTKHVDIKAHFIRHHHAKGDIRMVNIPTDDQLADVLTKALPFAKFGGFRDALVA